MLWSKNHPRNFWQCRTDFTDEVWNEALMRASPFLGLKESPNDIDAILELILGEARFGRNRFQLGLAGRLYYQFKPWIPEKVRHIARQIYLRDIIDSRFNLSWPIEPRYAEFLWETLRQAMLITHTAEISFRYFWPEGKRFSFVLTHDVETAEGQRLVPVLADLEESLGFRSLFNFVAERYPLDRGLMQDLRQRGFEIGLHGLKHDGKLFNSQKLFAQRALRINGYLAEFQAVGFRSPLTHRNPDWMQILKIDYDLSFFDSDPYEPMPGGVMSIWPFEIGHFLELPYTLPQDFTLFNIMGETTPKVWLEKVDFLKKYHGMALVIVHPDYSGFGRSYQIYESFLREMKSRAGFWHALPRDVARWWKSRTNRMDEFSSDADQLATATLNGDSVEITLNTADKKLMNAEFAF